MRINVVFQNLEFHGVMRFYFQDSGQKIATKCIRVASDATVSDVTGLLFIARILLFFYSLYLIGWLLILWATRLRNVSLTLYC